MVYIILISLTILLFVAYIEWSMHKLWYANMHRPYIVHYLVARAARIGRMLCVACHLSYLNVPTREADCTPPIDCMQYAHMGWWGCDLPLLRESLTMVAVDFELCTACRIGLSCLTDLPWYVDWVQTYALYRSGSLCLSLSVLIFLLRHDTELNCKWRLLALS